MSFSADFFILQTNGNFSSNGMPGLYGYWSSSDSLATILTDGYFPAGSMPGLYASPGDAVMIIGTDGYRLRCFDSSYNLVNPSSNFVKTITAASGSLYAGQTHIINNSSNGTYTLPDAGQHKGEIIYIKKISGLLITVTINTVNSQTIDGSSSLLMTVLNSRSVMVSDGSNWFIVG